MKKQLLALPLLLFLALSSDVARAAPPTEYEVKAAFVHNIAKFVEWPAAAASSSNLKLCVQGQGPLASAMEGLRGKPVGEGSWDVVAVGPRSNLRECRVLVLAESDAEGMRRALDGLKGSAVLTVGDTEGFAEQGVMVNFYLEQNKVRFEVNVEAVRRAGLKISSQLLKLARIVQEAGGRP